MSSTFELKTPNASAAIGRYAGSAPDSQGSHTRYIISDDYGCVLNDLTRADLAVIARWIVRELSEKHQES